MFVHWTYSHVMSQSNAPRREPPRTRGARLGFRVDAATKALVERAARGERRSLTDFCLATLEHAARTSLERHRTLDLSAADRAAFFAALMHPPKPHVRLRQAARRARLRIET